MNLSIVRQLVILTLILLGVMASMQAIAMSTYARYALCCVSLPELSGSESVRAQFQNGGVS